MRVIGVMKAAHRIKGSASYLCCEILKDVSLKLQDAGHLGTTELTPAIMETIEALFAQFVAALEALRAEIARTILYILLSLQLCADFLCSCL